MFRFSFPFLVYVVACFINLLMYLFKFYLSFLKSHLAKPVNALFVDRRGRRFESCHSDFFIGIPQSMDAYALRFFAA